MKTLSHRRAFSLVEVTLALGVAAVSLIAVFSLLPIGLQTSKNAVEQTTSNAILSAVAADLRATPRTTPPGNAATSAQFGISIPASPVTAATSSTLYFNTQGHASTVMAADSRYHLTVTFQPHSGARTATFVDLNMTWPAAATAATAAGTAEAFVALDRN